MDFETAIVICEILVAVLVLVIMILAALYFFNNRQEKDSNEKIGVGDDNQTNPNLPAIESKIGRFKEMLSQRSVLDFIEFDEIKDNMIIRKNKSQYLMVIHCNGVNFDLLSEDEKLAVEEGFNQFLNTLRFPVQLYIQSRTVNLKDTISQYKEKVDGMGKEIQDLNVKIEKARHLGNKDELMRLEFDKRRKINVLEYGENIVDYIERISLNRNVLQQKTYVIVPFYSVELGGDLNNFSKDEIDGQCFDELYTRTQTVMSALANSGVGCTVLDSEELAELLYVAYNRDDSEIYQLNKAIDAQYDALYSSGKDVLEKKEALLNEKLNFEAVDLATQSLMKADLMKNREDIMASEENRKEVKRRAANMVHEYQDRLSPKVYDYTMKEISKYGETNDKTGEEDMKRRVVRRVPGKGSEE